MGGDVAACNASPFRNTPLQFMTRRTLLACAEKAYAVRQVEAVSHVVAACEQLAAKGKK